MIYLLRCVFNNIEPSKDIINKINIEQLYQVAQRHSLSAIVAYALENVDIDNKSFQEAKNKAIRKSIILDIEREKVLAELEKSQIWYMPLKGSILKNYYPKIGMRQMADIDILFDAARVDDVKTIMEEQGFSCERFGGSNVDIYFKQPVCNFEMHNSLFLLSQGESLYGYYKNIKNKLLKDANNKYSKLFLHNKSISFPFISVIL